MNILLPPELEELVQEQIRNGKYSSPGEVIHAALWLFRDHELLRQIRLEELRKEIDKGMKDIEEGRVAPLDMEAIKAKVRARRGEC